MALAGFLNIESLYNTAAATGKKIKRALTSTYANGTKSNGKTTLNCFFETTLCRYIAAIAIIVSKMKSAKMAVRPPDSILPPKVPTTLSDASTVPSPVVCLAALTKKY